jgi:DNA mismatch endonuclease, patch repair protein
MTDVFSKEKRSQVMSQIRGYGNKETELALAKLMRCAHISGWRRNQKLFGKPDFAFLKFKLVIFIDGCFWHSCPIPKHSPLPKTRSEWWKNKLDQNRIRDRKVNRTLAKMGWRVIRVWEHELRDKDKVIKRLERAIAKRETERARV